MNCQGCGGRAGRVHEAHERMFGLGGGFPYLECAGCGSLTLIEPPASLSSYYPPGYYSFPPPVLRPLPPGAVRGRLARWRDRAQVFGRWPWRLLAGVRPRAELSYLRPFGRFVPSARILDVGCGGGQRLAELARVGFINLNGIDPFLPRDRESPGGVRLRPVSVFDLAGEEFDLVMFHHSLEHVPSPLATLTAAARLLVPGGLCLVRIPVVDCLAWRRYGTDWVELDAPRHLFLPTRRTMVKLARRAGLRLVHQRVEPDSFPYWGSELYRRGLTLYDSECRALRSSRAHFSRATLSRFRGEAGRAARRGNGGPGAFYFRRVGN